MLTVEDRLEIAGLVNLYGHIIDERQFSRVGEIFSDDAVCDVSKRGAGLHVGPEAIRRMWELAGDRHPLAHHATNIVIDALDGGTVRVLSKGICVHPDGTVHSTTYRQEAKRTARGWRLSRLEAEMREPGMIPAVS